MHPNDQDFANENDNPAAAFAALRGEIALLRRGIEQLAAERADITIPDYTATLTEISQRLNGAHQTLRSITDKPALKLAPESLAQRIDDAARKARQTDHEELHGARTRYDHASHELQGLVAAAHTARDQRRRLWRAAGAGMFAGCVLWAILPGAILRTLPDSWHGPEMMATHIVGEPRLWEAGMRLMQAGDPHGWQAIVEATDIWHSNRDVIDACLTRAAKAEQPVRCSMSIDEDNAR